MAPRWVPDAPAAVLAAAKELQRAGLVEGTAGNVSARQEDGSVVITPSAVGYEEMAHDDLVVVGLDGRVLSAGDGRSPSSELDLHLACYRAFDDVGAVLHAHPVHATMFAVARQPIDACIDELAIYTGGDVRVAEYAASGSEELGTVAVEALRGRGAALLANHGLVAVAPNPRAALHITALVERSARIVWGARMLGPVHPVPDDANQAFADRYSARRRDPR